MKKTAIEILKILNNNLSVNEFAHEDYDELELGLGPIKQIIQHGGEDEGSNWYVVNYFEDHDVYIKTQGWYSSYEGAQFEDGMGEEVAPTQKTITVYE